MIIPSKLIKLDYNVSTDVLSVKWPDFDGYSLEESVETISEVLRTVRHYDVKRLLIDSRSTIVNISREQYEKVATDFVKEIMKTRLEKVARIQTIDAMREEQVRGMSNSFTSIAFKNFSTETEAILWLQEGI